MKRVIKTSVFAKIHRSAKKFFSGSCYPAGTWGHQGCGISDSSLVRLERHALSCTGLLSAGRCRLLALVVKYGILGTPKARIIRDIFREWFVVVGSIGSELVLQDTISAWKKARDELYKHLLRRG